MRTEFLTNGDCSSCEEIIRPFFFIKSKKGQQKPLCFNIRRSIGHTYLSFLADNLSLSWS